MHLCDVVPLLQVHHRTDVQTADARVAVVARLRVVPPDDLVEPPDVLRQFLRRHGRILDERQGFGVAGHVHQQSEARLPHVPNLALASGIEQIRNGEAQPVPAHPLSELVEFVACLRRAFARELDHEDV